jgi:hypothetical protein
LPQNYTSTTTPADDKRIVLTDDHGQRVQMSSAHLRVLVDDIKDGGLDHLVDPAEAATI